MANSKISALTAAATPLAGTEVLPIVQSSVTVKVATDDLTVKNIRSNATTGILQIAGPAAASTRIATVPNANWTAARTDAAQSFTGDQTLSTGSIVQGTAAKGFNFTANTSAAGMTSQLLNWYEEGTVSVGMTASTSGTITLNASFKTLRYTRIGRQVTVTGQVNVTSVSAPVGILKLTGLPFTSVAGAANIPGISVLATGLAATAVTSITGIVDANATTVTLYKYSAGAVANLAADVQAGASFYLCIVYTV